MDAISKSDIKSVIKSDISFDINIKPTTWIAHEASYFSDNIVSKRPLWAGFTLSEQGLFNLPYAVQSCLGNFTISRFLSLVSDC